MRMISVAHATHKMQGEWARQDEPRNGTATRALYDFFLRNRGREVRFGSSANIKLDQLRDIYGLDIRRISYQRFCLAGEWFGHRYVDYTRTPSTENVPRDWREWQLNPPAPALSEAA